MCSRARYDGPHGPVVDWLEKVEQRSDLARVWLGTPREIAPTDGLLVLRTRGRTARTHDGPARRLDVVRWGLVPRGWRRVLVVSAAIEFPKGGPPRARGVPAPRVAITRADGNPLALAGIWEAWRRPGVPDDAPDAWLLSCSLLTTVPNETVRPIHHRTPVVLASAQLDAWLDPELPLVDAQALCEPCSNEVLDVSGQVTPDRATASARCTRITDPAAH